MLNLAYGISFSQLLLYSALNVYRELNILKPINIAIAKIVLSYEDFLEYLELKKKYPNKIFEYELEGKIKIENGKVIII